MKKCKKCGIEKAFEDFPKHKAMKDGLLSSCRKCYNITAKVYRDKNKDYYRKYRKEYYASDRGKEIKNKCSAGYRNRKRAYMKVWKLTENALLRGALKRQPCEVCGLERTHAHHVNYNEPLNVMWLCAIHHIEWHKNNKAIPPLTDK